MAVFRPVLACALVGALLCGCGTAVDRSANAGSFDFIAAMFPSTSQEMLSGAPMDWLTFKDSIENEIARKCLISKGFTLPSELPAIDNAEPNPLSAPAFTQFPDIHNLKEGSFDLPGRVTDPNGLADATIASIPLSARAAWTAGSDSCNTVSDEPFAKVDALQSRVEVVWGKETEPQQLEANPTVSAAVQVWAKCMTDAGYPSTSLENIWKYIDEDQFAFKGTDPNSYPPLISLAKTYGRCVVGVSKAMDTVRLAYRRQLLDKYALQIDSLQQQMSALVKSLSARYGVRFWGGG